MKILFLHQNAPAQYRHLAIHCAAKKDEVVYLTQPQGAGAPGVRIVRYQPEVRKTGGMLAQTVEIDSAIRCGLGAAEACRKLVAEGFHPDIVVGHSGWGETLFLKDVFPDTPVLANFEFYYHHKGSDYDFDPEFTSLFGDTATLRTRNAICLMALDGCDWGHSATRWQKSLFPKEWRSRITSIHEGVDTDIIRPQAGAKLRLVRDKLTLTAKDEVITFAARNLEPYRGFHTFMRALPQILKARPRAHIVIAGGDGVSYGASAPPGKTFRDVMLAEVGGKLDLSRVHFVGSVPYAAYLQLLQVSSVHVYLTYPFVLSWSLIEAMAAGCAIVGSDTPPVAEILSHGKNGLLVDFFDRAGLVAAVERTLDDRAFARTLGQKAREGAVARFDLRRRQIPRWESLLADLVAGRKPPLDTYRS